MKNYLIYTTIISISVLTTLCNITTANANSFLQINRTITNVVYMVEKDFDWLDNNFKENDEASVRILADVYIKCKWLEQYDITLSPITYCYYTNQNTSKSKWLNKIKHLKFIKDFKDKSFWFDGEPLRQTIWNR